jgi:hypothetical protein
MKSFMPFICLCFFAVTLPGWSLAGDSTSCQSFSAGLCFQKSVGFYWMNGLGAEYSSGKILKQKINFGFSFVTSRLGSAMGSNAIPLFEIRISAVKLFGSGKNFKPYAGSSLGYAQANFGSAVFKDIPNHSALLSIIAGGEYNFKFPFRILVGGGFNLINGKGISGLGTLFPVYAQCALLYRIYHPCQTPLATY